MDRIEGIPEGYRLGDVVYLLILIEQPKQKQLVTAQQKALVRDITSVLNAGNDLDKSLRVAAKILSECRCKSQGSDDEADMADRAITAWRDACDRLIKRRLANVGS